MIYLFSIPSTYTPRHYYHLFYKGGSIYKYYSGKKSFENDKCECGIIDYNIITGEIGYFHPKIYVEIYLKLESDEFILESSMKNVDIETNICKYLTRKIIDNI